jgi:helicase required for RNAi-mediated heterochromatin assembly 1
MAKKSRKHAGTQHHQYQHQHQRRGPQGPAANTHFALTSNERHDNGIVPSSISINTTYTRLDEINAHLPERFKGSHRATEDAPSAPDDAQLPTQSEANTARIREYFRKSEVSVKDGNWLAKPEVPTPAEILDDPYDGQVKATAAPEELRPNKLEGAYSSNEEYLSTQYDLLREDSLRPLREAVAQVRASPYLDEAEYNAGSNIGLYEPVYITSIVFSPRGLATRIAFSLSRVKKFIRWQQSKRLITGTLVALSPADDCFQTKCVLATVAARPVSALEQNPPEIDLFFARPQDLEVDPMKKWIMVEARSSFYEASRHTMLALQHIMEEP